MVWMLAFFWAMPISLALSFSTACLVWSSQKFQVVDGVLGDVLGGVQWAN